MIMTFAMFYEVMSINRDPKKEELNRIAGPLFEWFAFLLVLYWLIPITFPQRHVLIDSGFSEKDYPILFAILFTQRKNIALSMTIVFMGWFLVSL